MAIIHYTGYCPKCRKYQTKDNLCIKCGELVRRCNKWLETYRTEVDGKVVQKKSKMYARKSDLDQAIAMRKTTEPAKDIDEITFEQLTHKYLNHLLTYKKESSYVTAESQIRVQFFPFLKTIKLISLSISDFNNVKKSLHHLSPTYKSNLWGLLSVLLRFADRELDIPQPLRIFQKIEPYRRPKIKKPYWTTDEWNKFINKIEEIMNTATTETEKMEHFKYFVLFNFLYFDGNRKGEATATKVKHLHLDAEHPYCETVENISYKIIKEKRKKGITYNTTSPKTGERFVKIPTKLTELLKKYIDIFGFSKDDYLFFKNKPIPPQTLRNKMDNYVNLAGVKRITPHNLRNSIASRIFSTGDNTIASAYATAKRLGHSVKYALDTYGDLFDEEENKLLEKLDS